MINGVLGDLMKIISDFTCPENQIDFSKTIKFSDITDSVDNLLENVDLTLDKIQVVVSFMITIENQRKK